MPKTSALCPIRPGDPCSLCQPGADGPQNCGLVYLVMDDPDLRQAWDANRRAHRQRRAGGATTSGGAAKPISTSN